LSSSSYFKLVVILITSLIIWTLRDFLLLIICSLVISNIVCNLCNQIQKGLKIPRLLSLFLVLTVISVIVFSIFILVLPPFIKEFNEILVDIPNGLSKINILINTNLNKFNVLQNINYKFSIGKSYSIVGPSGSGKSTLLNIISMIDKPTKGNIFINNKKWH